MNSAQSPLEFTPVREGAELPVQRLTEYLRVHMPFAQGELEVFQFTGGHANLTYLLRLGGKEYVLRRPPAGKKAPGAHDMKREHFVLSGLAPHFPLAPRSYVYCDDTSVIGDIFVVIERRTGSVIRQDFPTSITPTPELCHRIGHMLISTLAAFHNVDFDAAGLSSLGNPQGYVERQLDGWQRRYFAAIETIESPSAASVSAIIAWLAKSLPASDNPTLVHNDFKLDNMIVNTADPGQAVALLDWDMATRGDPLMDLGYLLNYWTEPSDDRKWIAAAPMPTWRQGFPTRREAVRLYAEITGRNVDAIQWYYVFAVFKLIVILQQIYTRYLRKETTDPRFATFADRIALLAAKGEHSLRQTNI